jgi:hypothetical protein
MRLLDKSNKFSLAQFAALLNCANETFLQNFMLENEDKILQLMQTTDSMEDIATIVAAYSNIEPSASFWVTTELIVLKNLSKLSVDVAITLLRALNATASTETVEVFDRIIGKDIDALTPSQLYQALVGFLTVQRANVRPKILALLTKRISTNLERLKMSELTELAFVTAEDSMQQTLQLGDFILQKADSLTEQDLQTCLEAFKNDADKLLAFEEITLANLDGLSTEVASSILYTYAKERRGSRTFVMSLAHRVEHENPEQLDADLVAQIVVSLNLLGRQDTEAFKRFSQHAEKSL